MISIAARIAHINDLLTIICDQNKTDQARAGLLKDKIEEIGNISSVSLQDIILILQTRDGINGSKESLMHTAIKFELPHTFHVLYYAMDGATGLQKKYRQAFHGPNNFELAMADIPCFSSRDPGVGFIAGGVGDWLPTRTISRFDVITDQVFTWMDLLASEGQQEINMLRVDANINLANRLAAQGIRLPADTPVEYDAAQNERGEVYFVARSLLHRNI